MSFIPKKHLECVVTLGRLHEGERFKVNGTGFLYSHPLSGIRNDPTQGFTIWLVTCKHVVTGIKKDLSPATIMVRMNRKIRKEMRTFLLPHGWFLHPKLDIAVTPIEWTKLDDECIQWDYFKIGTDVISKKEARRMTLSEGHQVYVLGFPIGWRSGNRDYPIVRSGVLAQVQGWLNNEHDTFLVDGSGFPGNSGGPVIITPQNETIEDLGQLSIRRVFSVATFIGSTSIIGMVTQRMMSPLLPDVPALLETADLIEVIPMESIDKTIKLALKG